jgi:hypothetical protein
MYALWLQAHSTYGLRKIGMAVETAMSGVGDIGLHHRSRDTATVRGIGITPHAATAGLPGAGTMVAHADMETMVMATMDTEIRVMATTAINTDVNCV